MKTRNLALMIFCASLGGCGWTRIGESHVVQAVGKSSEVAYYRVTIFGNANMSKSSFRAGLYDADALDALSGEISGDGTGDVEQILRRRRAEAVDIATANYIRSLKDHKSATPQDARNQLAQALRLGQSSDDEAGPDTGARRKYAVIFSSKASEIEEAISGIVEEEHTFDSVLAVIAAKERRNFLRTQVKTSQIAHDKAELAEISKAATTYDKPTAFQTAQRLLDEIMSIPNR